MCEIIQEHFKAVLYMNAELPLCRPLFMTKCFGTLYFDSHSRADIVDLLLTYYSHLIDGEISAPSR